MISFFSGEIEDRLHNIESQMADQLNVIKTMILNIEDKCYRKVSNIPKRAFRPYGSRQLGVIISLDSNRSTNSNIVLRGVKI